MSAERDVREAVIFSFDPNLRRAVAVVVEGAWRQDGGIHVMLERFVEDPTAADERTVISAKELTDFLIEMGADQQDAADTAARLWARHAT